MKKTLISLITLLSIALPCFATKTLVQDRPDIRQFIDSMVTHYHFNRQELVDMFNTIKVAPPHSKQNTQGHSVVHRMKEKKDFIPWYHYKNLFVKKVRIDLGAQYWKKNEKWLNKANKKYGVPQSILVATIGIESKYGHEMGKYSVFKALAVLAFDNKHRQHFFKDQLIAFLRYCKANDLNALSVRGSYEGAIGQPQFIPGNLKRYGVDLNNDGKIDIIHQSADAIGSVANFFHVNHWKRASPVASPAEAKTEQVITTLLKKDHHPRMTIQEFAKHGVTSKFPVKGNPTATLIKLRDKGGPKYWLVFHNFYVLKNYNRSTDYAMALYKLSLAIRDRYQEINHSHHP